MPGRTLFRRLGLLETPLFAGWNAAALLGAGAREAEDAQLVEYAGTDEIGEACYRMHELVRLHARDCLADEPPGETAAAVDRLLGSCLAPAEQAPTAITHPELHHGPFERSWLRTASVAHEPLDPPATEFAPVLTIAGAHPADLIASAIAVRRSGEASPA
ncbi:hypothetical protein [Acrocarpospora sp. B8E8]|uniref:hypothetical protein n=1 Tax=Acrocarpospora sp. B8E8 TaxID=3153572 RepID=UPI00325C4D51